MKEMRIAIIADIHGNIHALEAVLRDIDNTGVEQVIVNGDLVNRGPNNVAVMEHVWNRGFIFTLGNHEDLVRMWVDHDEKIPAEWYNDPFWKGTALAAKQLSEAGWIDVMRELPMTCEINIPGSPKLLISHGSPRHYREGYGFYTTDESMAEIASQYPADIHIGSHTHRPFDRQLNSHRFLNTGAVGAPFNKDPRAQYLLLTLIDDDWQVDFRCVDYNREAALVAFEETQYYPEGGLSAFIFWEELRYACPLYDPFWRWAAAVGRSTNWESWQAFRQVFKDKFYQPRLNRRCKV